MGPKKKPETVAMRSVKGGVFQQQKKGKGKVTAAPQPPPRGLGVGARPSSAAAPVDPAAATAAAAPVDPAAATAAAAPVDPAAAAAEETLRSFDLDGRFGPCVNPTRLERWERAERLGLDPPEEVRALLERFAAAASAGPGAGPRKAGVSDRSLWHGRV